MQTTTDRMGGMTWTRYYADTPADLDYFRAWIRERAAEGVPVGVDSEATGLDLYSDGFRLRLVQFGTPDAAWLIPVEYGPAWAEAAAWALRTLPRMVAHNAPFDTLVFDRHLGVALEDVWPRMLDTRIYAHLIDSRRDYEGGIGQGLKALAAHYVDAGAEDGARELQAEFRAIGCTKATGWAAIDINNDTYQRYAAADVAIVTRLLSALQAEVEAREVPQPLIDYEHRLAKIGAVIQRRGMHIDVAYTERLVSELREEERHYTDVARGYGVESVNAPKQVAAALEGMGETLTERTGTGALSVGKEVLLPLADLTTGWERIGAREPNPLADAVLRAKRAGKWRASYAEAMLRMRDADDVIHPRINTLGARTARWSVSDPPLQQLPSSDWRIRRCVVAPPGMVVAASDFAQVELRVLAALAGADRIVERVNRGEDLHTLTTRLVYGIGDEMTDEDIKHDKRRKRTKVISLGKAYAGGPTALAKQTGLPLDQVKQAINQYDRALPEIAKFARRMEQVARRQGMTIRTPAGRTLRLDRDKTYAAVAYLCQSSARDVLGQALCDLDDAGLLPHVMGVVHDEILIYAPQEGAAETIARVGECMEMDFFGVRIESDPEVYGTSWGSGYGMPVEMEYAAP